MCGQIKGTARYWHSVTLFFMCIERKCLVTLGGSDCFNLWQFRLGKYNQITEKIARLSEGLENTITQPRSQVFPKCVLQVMESWAGRGNEVNNYQWRQTRSFVGLLRTCLVSYVCSSGTVAYWMVTMSRKWRIHPFTVLQHWLSVTNSEISEIGGAASLSLFQHIVT